ncbi:MAG TPA: hypothetical protein VHW09_29995 [Bryobacteraceae bacterium]|jgi:hypothetical protein|nr:hypothetical protein [Bryobacteraceae bacterium]
MQFTRCAFAVLLAAPVFGSGGNPESVLTVHEWGTFTTISDGHGGAEPWSPLGVTSDLPCFVERLNGLQYKSMPQLPGTPSDQSITVRMETPVLYFYSPRKTAVSVGVDFPKGLITEWYPAASNVSPNRQFYLPPVRDGHIEWNSVEVAPGDAAALPASAGASHYFAARHTDAAAVRIGKQSEKFLFYRGVANFAVPLSVRMVGENALEVRNSGGIPLAFAVLFEKREGHIGYRVLHGLQGASRFEVPPLTGNLEGLEHELAGALVSQGLYRKEAEAMIETWRDSWFEDGMRVFYLLPRALVDRELPLAIQPAPHAIARVFMGREEVLSPFMRQHLMTALSGGDPHSLDDFGRFLVPFMRQVNVAAAPSVNGYLAAREKQAKNEFYSPTCVR